MLLALLLCIALPKTSSAQRVSVVLENVSLAEALKKVSAASGYEFFYNSNVVLKSDKRITASFDGTELKTVLDHVFSGTEFSYRIKDRTIVVVPRPAQPAPEEPAFVEIAGRITDGSNKLTDTIDANTAKLTEINKSLAKLVKSANALVLSDNMAVSSRVAASGTAQIAAAAGSYREGDTNITQNIYSKAHTAADLQREARWEADRAKAQKR